MCHISINDAAFTHEHWPDKQDEQLRETFWQEPSN
jgi:hypothetical protein